MASVQEETWRVGGTTAILLGCAGTLDFLLLRRARYALQSTRTVPNRIGPRSFALGKVFAVSVLLGSLLQTHCCGALSSVSAPVHLLLVCMVSLAPVGCAMNAHWLEPLLRLITGLLLLLVMNLAAIVNGDAVDQAREKPMLRLCALLGSQLQSAELLSPPLAHATSVPSLLLHWALACAALGQPPRSTMFFIELMTMLSAPHLLSCVTCARGNPSSLLNEDQRSFVQQIKGVVSTVDRAQRFATSDRMESRFQNWLSAFFLRSHRTSLLLYTVLDMSVHWRIFIHVRLRIDPDVNIGQYLLVVSIPSILHATVFFFKRSWICQQRSRTLVLLIIRCTSCLAHIYNVSRVCAQLPDSKMSLCQSPPWIAQICGRLCYGALFAVIFPEKAAAFWSDVLFTIFVHCIMWAYAVWLRTTKHCYLEVFCPLSRPPVGQEKLLHEYGFLLDIFLFGLLPSILKCVYERSLRRTFALQTDPATHQAAAMSQMSDNLPRLRAFDQGSFSQSTEMPRVRSFATFFQDGKHRTDMFARIGSLFVLEPIIFKKALQPRLLGTLPAICSLSPAVELLAALMCIVSPRTYQQNREQVVVIERFLRVFALVALIQDPQLSMDHALRLIALALITHDAVGKQVRITTHMFLHLCSFFAIVASYSIRTRGSTSEASALRLAIESIIFAGLPSLLVIDFEWRLRIAYASSGTGARTAQDSRIVS